MFIFFKDNTTTRNALCETRYLPRSHVHDKRTVLIIMVGCISHARNGHISTSGLKSDVTVVFLDLDSRVGPGCVLCPRIDPLRFLAGCRRRRLNEGLVVALGFYSASALLAMQSAVLARGILSVRLSVRHVLVLRPDEWRYDRAVFSIW